jgi:hypothetical protein
MKIVAVVLGILVLAGTIVLVIAGASTTPRMSNAMGPLAFLLCIVAVAAMIVLGVTLGGRNNPRRAPHSPAHTSTVQASAAQTVDSVPGQSETDEPGDPA